MGSADAQTQKWFEKFLYQSFIIQNNSHEILVGSNVWLLIDEWWFASYSILASIYSTGMCATLPVARVLLEATLLCYETNCKPYLRDHDFIVDRIYRTDVLQIIYIYSF